MTIKAIRVNSRDVSVLSEIGEVGLLDVETLWERHFPADHSGKACLRRLRLFCAHDILLPISVSVSFAMERSGRPRRLFRLTERGAELLQEMTGRSDLHFSNKELRPETVMHRLGVAKLRLTVNDACGLQRLQKPRWIGEYDTVPNVHFEAKFSERFILCEKLLTPDGGYASCWPDASCCLRIPHPSGQGEAALLVYWEYDRSTETLTQVAGKIPGFHALLATAVYRKHWPDVDRPAVRVFFVTQSEERLHNIREAIKNLQGAEHVRLAVLHDMKPERLLSAPIWKTVAGDARPILRSPFVKP
ncbi:MAG: replication-relaxation family protein [Planctomycetes bacterium]|nr:replication-relaxation family protein [Planctomycetota bacterium]